MLTDYIMCVCKNEQYIIMYTDDFCSLGYIDVLLQRMRNKISLAILNFLFAFCIYDLAH